MALSRKNNPQSKKADTPPASLSWDDIMTPGTNTGLTTDKQLGDLPKKEKASKRKAVVIGILVVLAIVVPMFFMLNHYAKERNAIIEQNLTTVQETPKKVESKVKPDGSSAYKNPAEDSSDVGSPAKGDTEGRVDGKKIILKSENRESAFSFPSMKDKINGVSSKCVLNKGGANCYLGEAVDGKKIILKSENRESAFSFPSMKDKINGVSSKCVLNKGGANCYLGEATSSNGKKVRFWAFRDAKSSALLSSTNDANIVSAGGAALAFTTKSTDDGKKNNYLYIVLKNQTGVMAVTEDSVALDAMINGADAFQVQQG